MALEEPSDFFDADEFATAALYDGAYTVNGIFDDEYRTVDPGAGDFRSVGVQSAETWFHCVLADVPEVEEGKTLEIDGTTYRIRVPETDGLYVTLPLTKL